MKLRARTKRILTIGLRLGRFCLRLHGYRLAQTRMFPRNPNSHKPVGGAESYALLLALILFFTVSGHHLDA